MQELKDDIRVSKDTAETQYVFYKYMLKIIYKLNEVVDRINDATPEKESKLSKEDLDEIYESANLLGKIEVFDKEL